MAFESVRSYVQLASGLGEMTKAKAMDAAQGLLALPGADEVTRRAVQASTLADQLLEAARANRANLLTLIQGEVESALKKADVARVADVMPPAPRSRPSRRRSRICARCSSPPARQPSPERHAARWPGRSAFRER